MGKFHFEEVGVISCLNNYKEYELMKKLEQVAHIAVNTCAGIKPGEKVLLLGDTGSDERVMDMFMYKCRESGAEAIKMSFHFVESVLKIPERVAQAMWECDVLIPFTKSQILYSNAIAKTKKNARILYMADLETHNMIRPVVLKTDFEEMSKVASIITPIIQNARKIEVRSKAGTSATMVMDPARPTSSTDSMVRNTGELDYLPGGSWAAAPVEDSVNGVFVVDGSLYPIGVITEPVYFHYKDGWLIKIEGGKQAKEMQDWMEYRSSINDGDQLHYWFSHIGGGINKNACYTGNLMEDERVWNAFCISGGANDMSFNGKNHAKSHWDGMCRDITMLADDVIICEDGKFVHKDLQKFEE